MERPILMTTESVKAILDGRKSQTRRVAKFANHLAESYDHCWAYFDKKRNQWQFKGRSRFSDLVEAFILDCPYGQVGDRLWVRETCKIMQFVDHKGVVAYKTTANPDPETNSVKWTPSIFMPRWASRITLEITEIRVERLQEIENHPEDYKAEGYVPLVIGKSVIDEKPFEASADFAWFENLWDLINGKKYPWSSNPWVWVIKFDNIGVRVK